MKETVFNTYKSTNWFQFYVQHNNKKLRTYSFDFNDNEVIIQTCRSGNKQHPRLSVHCWYGPKGRAELIYDSGNDEPNGSAPYEKNRIYNNVYYLDKKKMEVRKLLTNKEGHELLKVTPHVLGRFDPDIDNFDIQCACGEWGSNPIYGFVEKLGTYKGENKILSANSFSYKGFLYRRVPFEYQRIKTFYNEAQYKKYVLDSGREEKNFYEIWDDLFKESSKEIIGKPNMPCAGWRDSVGNICYFSGIPSIGAYEKVFSFGYMTTPAKGLEECPCCKDIHDIYSDTLAYYPRFGVLKRKWYMSKFYKIYKKIIGKKNV
jgi:hypothetical protein